MERFDREDWAEHFFEWYRTVGILATIVSFIQVDSPAIRRMNTLRYLILTALLNRCARLVMSNLCLASDGKHNDVISLINRSLHETTIKLAWLCKTRSPDRFRRFLADGLKSDLEFKGQIKQAIAVRGHRIEIEGRMLQSIRNSISSAKMTEKTIRKTKRLPNLAAMIRDMGMSDLSYVIIQRMGSHFVHGTWTGLLNQSLEPNDAGGIQLRGEQNRPHPNGFMFASVLILDCIEVFLKFVTKKDDQKAIVLRVRAYSTELRRHNSIMASGDDDKA